MSTTLAHFKTLLALKVQADPLAAQLNELGKAWKETSDALDTVLDKTKAYTFLADDGSAKIVSFVNGQIMIGDAVDAAAVPDPIDPPAAAENVAPLVPAP
jgi:uncharacterized protein with LGFP repeats